MVKKRAKADGGTAVARAIAAEMKKRSRRAWTIVEYAEADWTHGYCTGERAGAWKFAAGKLAKVKPPAILEVPYAQFCARGLRVLVETSIVRGSGQGEIFEVRRGKGGAALESFPEGVKWRVGM
jgi:hypothetical protein